MLPADDRPPARLAAALCLLLWLLPLVPAGARDNPLHQAIAAAVQSLGNGEPVTIAGEPLASRIMLPALYERHDYAPLWSNPRAIDQLPPDPQHAVGGS